MQWLTRAAEAGHIAAQSRLAAILAAGGHGVARNGAGAVQWAQKAAFKDRESAGLLCRLYRDGKDGTTSDNALAFRWCTAAAESGLTSSIITLAELYLNGEGTASDPSAAFYWAIIASGRAQRSRAAGSDAPA